MTSKKDTTDYYRVLELPRDCTQKEISASYRRLALLHHPDKTGGDKFVAIHFQQIQEAGEVLRDPKCRLLYDKTLGLQSTSTLHGYRKRYEPYDIPRNTNESEIPEQECDTPWSSKPPPAEYMYTWGSSVHMNLDSDWAQAEVARRAEEMDEWERLYAGIDPEVQKADNEYQKKFDEEQVPPEGEAMINDGAGEGGGLGPSSQKQTEETNEDGRDHSHIDPEVQRSNERLYAYGMKGGVPSDDEDSLPKRPSGDTGDLGWGNHDDGDGLGITTYKDYLYDTESEAGSEYHSATSTAGPLIDLIDDEKDCKAGPGISNENETTPTKIPKPATDNGNSSKGTGADAIATNEQDSDSTSSIIGCFIDLSDDEQDYEANPKSSKENEAESAENFELAIIKDDPPMVTEMANITAADEQDAGSTTGSIGCFIDLSDDEQDTKVIEKRVDVLG
ncbi:hypothetical protein N7451_003217 [Penicillium sp. IBT 35674x]|nr:hypothetical protein N7451_003217 [Penicillium sp. IBT 35674x]